MILFGDFGGLRPWLIGLTSPQLGRVVVLDPKNLDFTCLLRRAAELSLKRGFRKVHKKGVIVTIKALRIQDGLQNGKFDDLFVKVLIKDICQFQLYDGFLSQESNLTTIFSTTRERNSLPKSVSAKKS